MATKKKSLKEQKARKQKMILIVGGALLAVVLVIQAPRILSIVHGGGEESTTAPYKAFPDAVLNAGAAKPVAVSSAGAVVLPDADTEPDRGTGQLIDFALFPSKDPFRQQVKARLDGQGAPAADEATAPNGGSEAQQSGGSDSSGSASFDAGGGQVEAAPTSAAISVNGDAENVQLGGKFPSEDPAFVLVSATQSTARIGIAGGSLASGDKTVTLRRGHTLTLVNTVDGTEYHIQLVSIK
jgi:hypothetical protein